MQVPLKVRFIFRSNDSIDAGRTTLAGQPISLPHPFQVDDMTQRVQHYTRPVPRQFRYLLPFRVQVCRVQCPLPCSPSTVLFCDVSLLSAGSLRSGSPTSLILRRRYAILHCIPVAYGFASGFHASLTRFVYRLRAPVRPEAVFSGQGHFDAGVPHSGFSARTAQDFSGSQAIHPAPLPYSKTPAGSTVPHHDGPVDAAPALPTVKAPAIIISRLLTRLQHLLPTLHDGRRRTPCKARFRLVG